IQFMRSVGWAPVFTAALVACGGGGSSDDGASTGMGTVRFALTDAPSCGFDAVNVTIQKVRIHQSSSAADSDAGWSEVTLSPARRVDLLSLPNRVLSELGQTPPVPGKYQQVRLALALNHTDSPQATSLL